MMGGDFDGEFPISRDPPEGGTLHRVAFALPTFMEVSNF